MWSTIFIYLFLYKNVTCCIVNTRDKLREIETPNSIKKNNNKKNKKKILVIFASVTVKNKNKIK